MSEEEKTPHSLWDKLFKIVGDRFPQELVQFICPGKRIRIEAKFEQERVVIESQTADINFWVLDKGIRKLLNIEPYSAWADSIPAVVFTRNGIITKSLDYKHQVISVAIVLDKGSHQGIYRVNLGSKLGNRYQFPVVCFKDIPKILAQYRFLAPFVLKVDRSYQDKVIEVVKGDRILTAITVLVLNRLGLNYEEALKMTGAKLEEFRLALLEVPIMQDVAKEWTKQAIEETKAEEKKAIAQNMVKEGLAVALIAKITGLNPEEIAKLKQE
jgi:hypothetical protein